MTFAERLERLIKENKTSQTALAEYAGIRRPSISEWKKEGTLPRADVALKIAEFLGVSVEYLITGAEPAGKPDAAKPDTTPIIAHLEAALDDLKRL
jgi:transcriptional regulator with XRE-family HTH domain